MLLRLLFTGLLLIPVARGDIGTDDLFSKKLVLSEIELSGLQRTTEKVVLQEFLIEEGKPITQADYKESLQRLKNLQIFAEVKPELNLIDEHHVKLISHFEEKWTTIPVLRGSSGGDAQYIVIGAYDINAFGRYKEIGGQYENYNGKHSGVLWYRNPRFFGQRLLFGLDVWSVARPYASYDARSEVTQRLALERKKLNSFLDLEFTPWLTLGTGIELDRDSLLDEKTSLEYYRSDANIVRINLSLGRINHDNYLSNGFLSKIELEKSLVMQSRDEDFLRLTWVSDFYKRLPWDANLAVHLRSGVTDSQAFQHRFFLGGLENIRGYFDNQFNGQRFWQGNFEFRLPSYRSKLFVLQHIVFVDAAQIAENADAFFKSTLHSSYGTGIRLISPKIYRLTLRLDVARANTTTQAGAISFGAQQFF